MVNATPLQAWAELAEAMKWEPSSISRSVTSEGSGTFICADTLAVVVHPEAGTVKRAWSTAAHSEEWALREGWTGDILSVGPQQSLLGSLSEWGGEYYSVAGILHDAVTDEDPPWARGLGLWARCTACSGLAVFNDTQSFAARPCSDYDSGGNIEALPAEDLTQLVAESRANSDGLIRPI